MAREAAGTSRWQDGNSGVPARRIGREGRQPHGQGEGDGNVAQQHKRWVEVTPSQFTHEAEGLNIVRDRLPDNAPFRAWSNLEFRDDHGKWHEVDLLVLGRRRLHLVELKYYSGTLRGDDLTWRRDGHRAEDSPLKLARRKAQRLASKLQDELIRWAQETGARIPDPRAVVPFVQEAVFLHHPGIRCMLPQTSQLDIFGLDGSEHETGLAGISQRLLEPPTPQHSVGANRDEIIVRLMERIGFVQRRQREAGSWVIDEDALDEGDGWQDWPAFHRVATTERVRIRFLVTPPGATATSRAKVRQVAEHEYRIMSRLASDRLLRPRDLVDSDLGVGLVYPFDDRFQRLDLWLADHASSLPAEEQLRLLRDVAEAVDYAHRNRVVHRGLTPHAVSVRPLPDGDLQVLVGDWQSSGAVARSGLTGLSSSGVTGLMDSADRNGADNGGSRAEDQPRIVMRPGAVDVDRRLAEAFEAPEGVWNRDADRIRLDVFSLGALAYFVLVGRPGAADRASLRERLHRDNGLDLAADLPQVPPAVRALVLEATRPTVSERLPDVRSFLELLADAEQALSGPAEEVSDPLDAAPGEVIDGRFELIRRLGRGSTAVGLLVTDLTMEGSGTEATRVLKVAVDDAAGARIADEAEVLAGLTGPRLVRIVEGPLDIGGRQALLLESAGDETLAGVMRGRDRLSLDLLERWGSDLLEALVALDRAGIDHRDIKPANLGVREGRSDRAKHLVLFDFSLSRASASAVTAGTPPYLDPFLDAPERGRHDSAAERYSAAVVLFEMATGATPRFGDGLSDPASVRDEATIETRMFDATVADTLVAFFRTALARSAKERFGTATDMLAAWRNVFAPVPKTVPDDANERATVAVPATPLAEAGLSARALSALEPIGVTTVGDLVAVDPVRLNRLSGVAEATRREVKARARQWRDGFGSDVAGRGSDRLATEGTGGAEWPDPVTAAELLLAHAGTARAASRRATARLLLGLDPGLEPFGSQNELAVALDVSRARAAQQVAALQDGWAAQPACRDLLDAMAETARRSLAESGGVATVMELADAIRAFLPPSGITTDPDSLTRIAAGLLRLALDRSQALYRADAGEEQFAARRRGGRITLLATDAALLDPAEALGRSADALVAQARSADETLVPAVRAAQRLRDDWIQACADQPAALSDTRLLRLAASLAQDAAVSGSNELYRRDLSLTDALGLALRGAGGSQAVGPHEVRDRVRARFPALPALPDRPRLDQLINDARLGLVYDEGQHGYRWPTRAADTKDLASRQATVTASAAPQLVSGGRSGHRLAESATARSFLALGVDADRTDRAVDALTGRFGAMVIDVTQVLVDAMRAQAAEVGLPWDLVRAADAAPQGSRDATGLAALVQRSLPAIEAAIGAAASGAPEGTRPVLLTEVAPLARYGHLAMLSRWTDLAARRPQAIWVLVPQLSGSQGAIIDRRPLPLAAPGQFFRLDAGWIDSRPAVAASEGAS
jgi:serine/threonine protein kinase